MKLIASTDLHIVGIISFRDTIVLATEHGVYMLKEDGEFEPMKIRPAPDEVQYFPDECIT